MIFIVCYVHGIYMLVLWPVHCTGAVPSALMVRAPCFVSDTRSPIYCPCRPRAWLIVIFARPVGSTESLVGIGR